MSLAVTKFVAILGAFLAGLSEGIRPQVVRPTYLGLKLEVGLKVLIGGYPTTVLLAEIVLQALLLENGQIIETAIQSVSEKINLVSALGDCWPVNALTKTDTVETSYLQPDR